MATDPFFFDVPTNGFVTIVNADSTNKKTVLTGATNGTKVVSVIATTDDTALTMKLWITKSGTSYLLGTFSIPSGAGNTTSALPVNLLDSAVIGGLPFDNDGNPFLILESGDTLQVSVSSAVTAAKTAYISAFGGKDS